MKPIRDADHRQVPAAADRLDVSVHDVPFPSLPPGLDGCRIVQLSDLHRGRGDTDGLIEEAVSCANELAPDYVFLTGDLVEGPRQDILPTIKMLAGLRAQRGVYVVFGNHDQRGDPALLASGLEAAGFRVLDNAAVELVPGFWLAGSDDLHEGHGDLVATLRDVPLDAPGFLLSHNPRAFDRVDKQRPLVILSGHTHGGQWHIPLLPPVAICLWHLHTRFVEGWYRAGALRMYVTRGIGITGPGLLARRINCPPEIALFRLRRAPAG